MGTKLRFSLKMEKVFQVHENRIRDMPDLSFYDRCALRKHLESDAFKQELTSSIYRNDSPHPSSCLDFWYSFAVTECCIEREDDDGAMYIRAELSLLPNDSARVPSRNKKSFKYFVSTLKKMFKHPWLTERQALELEARRLKRKLATPEKLEAHVRDYIYTAYYWRYEYYIHYGEMDDDVSIATVNGYQPVLCTDNDSLAENFRPEYVEDVELALKRAERVVRRCKELWKPILCNPYHPCGKRVLERTFYEELEGSLNFTPHKADR